MNPEAARTRFHDGLSQGRRLRTPLLEGWFRPDEFRLEQILTLVQDYTRLVKFHDDDDRPEGPWESLFRGSDAVVMAEILSIPTARLEREFLEGSTSGGLSAWTTPRELVVDWIHRLGRASSPVGSELRSVLQGLLSGIQTESGYLPQLQAVKLAQEGARRLFPRALESGDLDPATGVLVAFAKLYRRIQDRFDGFAPARSEFHFRKILGATPMPGVPDMVHLVAPAAGGKDVLIPRGTEFDAGNDEKGRPVMYCADEDTRMGDARVARILTLYAEPTGAPSPSATRTIDGLWIDEPIQDARSPLFGAERGGGPSAAARRARVGFLVADPTLLLREGERRVRITFLYRPESVAGSMFGRESPVREDGSTDLEAIGKFYNSLRDAFRISMTGESGWLLVPEYLPSSRLTDPSLPEACLSIEFDLPREAEPIVPFSREMHGSEGNTSLPAVRFEIRDRSDPHPIELFSGCELREILVEVEAKGCRDLVLHNQNGPISPLTPFPPFGPLPSTGSYLVVGCPEAQSKELSEFRLEVRWSDLPQTVDDFCEWYSGYKEPCSTSGFRARPGVLSDGRWIDVDRSEDNEIELFGPILHQGAVAGIAPDSSLSFHRVLGFRSPLPARDASGELRYSPTSQGGFFRLTLTSPTGAFGHQEYPHLLTRSLMKAARLKNLDAAPQPPNPPYTPTISSISLDYSARSRIGFDTTPSQDADPCQPRMIHLAPFGWESISRRNHSKILQLPEIDSPGSLFIGLEGTSFGGETRLLFRIANDSKLIRKPSRVGLRWWYLDDNRWREVQSKNVRSDSTEGFGASGIVALELPADLSRKQTMMPEGLVWLRATAKDYLDHFGHLLSIHAQALRATLAGMHDDHRRTSANSISAPRHPLPGLGQVTQPDPSFGGRAPESPERLRTRVSERLRHKGRAVEPGDFERLVLEAFPEVSKVKCFANLRRALPVTPCPGHILVVPLPWPDPTDTLPTDPSLNGRILFEIQRFLESRAGVSAKISVANPWYERIQVHCTVGFRPNRSEGAMMADLDRAIQEWISPWSASGRTTHFGWRLRRQSLEAFVQDHPDVDELKALSILRVVPRPSRLFGLEDIPSSHAEDVDVLSPSYPWSVPSPLPSHIAVSDSPRPETAHTGFGELGIGSTFVITPGGTE